MPSGTSSTRATIASTASAGLITLIRAATARAFARPTSPGMMFWEEKFDDS